MSPPNDNSNDAIINASDTVVDVDDGLRKDPENQQPTNDQPNNHRLRSGAMSTTSGFYDRGNKGYLDETEELVRSYDKNGNGTIDMAAAMDLAHNARVKERKVQQTRTWAIVATVAAILFAAATFGLVWVALILSKEVETDGENALVSTNSKTIVKTYNHGCLNQLKFIDELIQNVNADGSVEVALEADDSGLVLLGQVPMAEVEQSYAAISQDFHICTAIWTIEGVEKARKIDPTDIARHVDPTNGNIRYDGILVTDSRMGDVNVVVKCNSDEKNCNVYRHLPEGNRKLGVSDTCFSPNSSVMTESKGVINIMDLEVNDRVLSSDGSYSTIFSFGHRSVDQESVMLRIETEATTIELSANHMIYLAGKDLPVIAESVVVGDKLVRVLDDLKSTVSERVIKITEIDVKGFVSPLTISGDIIVDNIVASSYAVVGNLGSEYYYYHGEGSMLNIHSQTLAHISMTPLRMACTWVSSSLCKEEYHNPAEHEDYAGAHFYTTFLLYLVKFGLSAKCGLLLHVILFAITVGSCLFLFLVETCLPTIMLYGGILYFFTLANQNKTYEESIPVPSSKKIA